jgi:hypothetical protein
MDKRLMKLAGLLKENFELPDESPFEGEDVFQGTEGIIEHAVELAIAYLQKLEPDREEIERKILAQCHRWLDYLSTYHEETTALVKRAEEDTRVMSKLNDKFKELYDAKLDQLVANKELSEDLELPDESPFVKPLENYDFANMEWYIVRFNKSGDDGNYRMRVKPREGEEEFSLLLRFNDQGIIATAAIEQDEDGEMEYVSKTQLKQIRTNSSIRGFIKDILENTKEESNIK